MHLPAPLLVGTEHCLDVSLNELLVQFKFRVIPFISVSKMAHENLVEQGIPEELLLNILVRLPPKSFVRCKLVCKRWAFLISGPFFVRSYVHRFPSSSSSSWTVVGERVKDKCVKYDRPKHIRSRQDFDKLCLSIDRKRKKAAYKVLGANDGLFLFGLIDRCLMTSYVSCNHYYICNPSIQKLIWLSPPSSPDKSVEWNWGSGLVARVENGDVLESFRVVLLLPDPETERLRFKVYASEIQEWKEYIVPSKIPTRHISSKLPTTLNQILHWATSDGSIIAYDPYAKPDRVRVIPPPKDIDHPPDHLGTSCLCYASEGKLRYFERFDNTVKSCDIRLRLRVWVLEDYKSGLWRLSHELDEKSIRFDDSSSSISLCGLAFAVTMFSDPFYSDILYLGLCRRIVSYDVKVQRFEVVQDYSRGRRAANNYNKVFPCYLAFLVQLLPWSPCLGPFSF